MHVVSSEKINCGHSATSLYNPEWFVFSLGILVDDKLRERKKTIRTKGANTHHQL